MTNYFTNILKNNGNGFENTMILKNENNSIKSFDKNIESIGFKNASQFYGNTSMFKLGISKLVEEYKDISKKREFEQEEKKQSLKKKLKNLKSEKELTEANLLEINDKKIPALEKDNISLLNEINNIKNRFNKAEYSNILIFNKPQFIIEVTAWVLLTLFLIVFYMNATYSAFIKNIGVNLSEAQSSSNLTLLFNSIFDSNTFDVATQNVFLFLFICLAPITVLAFGIMVHNLYSKKSWGFMVFLIAAVFIYDALIAYQIVEKIYEAKYLTGLVNKPWSFKQVFSLGEFYLVLMSGFVMYLIWEGLLNFVLNEWANSKPERFAIKERKLKIEKNNAMISELKKEANDIRLKINSLKKEIENLEYEIDNFIYLDLNQLRLLIYSYAQGWAKFVSNSETDIREMLNEISQITEQTINSLSKEGAQ